MPRAPSILRRARFYGSIPCNGEGLSTAPIGRKAQPAAAGDSRHRRLLGPGMASEANYAVGLEMSCPGGAYHSDAEIPSAVLRAQRARPIIRIAVHFKNLVKSQAAQDLPS
jgi:hypothetical protein